MLNNRPENVLTKLSIESKNQRQITLHLEMLFFIRTFTFVYIKKKLNYFLSHELFSGIVISIFDSFIKECVPSCLRPSTVSSGRMCLSIV